MITRSKSISKPAEQQWAGRFSYLNQSQSQTYPVELFRSSHVDDVISRHSTSWCLSTNCGKWYYRHTYTCTRFLQRSRLDKHIELCTTCIGPFSRRHKSWSIDYLKTVWQYYEKSGILAIPIFWLRAFQLQIVSSELFLGKIDIPMKKPPKNFISMGRI